MSVIKQAEEMFGVKARELTPFERKRLSIMDKDVLAFSVDAEGKINILLRKSCGVPFLMKFSLKDLYKKKSYTKRWLVNNQESRYFEGVSKYYQRIINEISLRKNE